MSEKEMNEKFEDFEIDFSRKIRGDLLLGYEIYKEKCFWQYLLSNNFNGNMEGALKADKVFEVLGEIEQQLDEKSRYLPLSKEELSLTVQKIMQSVAKEEQAFCFFLKELFPVKALLLMRLAEKLDVPIFKIMVVELYRYKVSNLGKSLFFEIAIMPKMFNRESKHYQIYLAFFKKLYVAQKQYEKNALYSSIK